MEAILPSVPLKRDSKKRRQEKRRLCQRLADIEPIIGYLKQQPQVVENWLKGVLADAINLLMAACE